MFNKFEKVGRILYDLPGIVIPTINELRDKKKAINSKRIRINFVKAYGQSSEYISFQRAKFFSFIVFSVLSPPKSYRFIRKYFSKLEKIWRTRGLSEMVRYNKDIRTLVQSKILGEEKRILGVRSIRGLPIILNRYVRGEIVKLNIPFLRCILTMLNWTKSINAKIKPSFDSITSPYTGIEDLSRFKKYIIPFFVEIKAETVPMDIDWSKYHLTSKSGPNSHALWNWPLDFISLPPKLKESIKILGGQRLSDVMDALEVYKDFYLEWFADMRPDITHIYKKKAPYAKVGSRDFRKISFFNDGETKVRVIAILDYFSQTALRPLHKYIFNLLRKIKQDFTHNQGGFKDKITSIYPSVFHSLDLKEATDRFPISLQFEVLKELIGEKEALAWKDIMVGYPFKVKVGKEVKSLEYKVGNPMGAYSSWAVFTFCHHFVMFVACQELGLSFKKAKYFMLGDDVVVYDDKLAQRYRDLMKCLGVVISESKTHVSIRGFEFAKRIIVNKEEVSPLPIKGILNNWGDLYLLTAMLASREDKGLDFGKAIPIIMEVLAKQFGVRFPKFEHSLLRKVKIAYYMYNLSQGRVTFYEVIFKMAQFDGEETKKFMIHPEDWSWIFKSLFVLTVKDHFIKNNLLFGWGLSGVFSKLPMMPKIKGLYPKDCIPILALKEDIQKLFKDKYESVEKLVISGDKWPAELKYFTVPASDRVFFARQFESVKFSSSKLFPIWYGGCVLGKAIDTHDQDSDTVLIVS